jgi:hypothetical protein
MLNSWIAPNPKSDHDMCFYSVEDSLPEALHFPCATWIFRAVVRVNTAPQIGHSALATTPDFSRWWRRRLLNVENSRPLQPWSQHCGRGRELTTRTGSESDVAAELDGEYIGSGETIGRGWELVDAGWDLLVWFAVSTCFSFSLNVWLLTGLMVAQQNSRPVGSS